MRQIIVALILWNIEIFSIFYLQWTWSESSILVKRGDFPCLPWNTAFRILFRNLKKKCKMRWYFFTSVISLTTQRCFELGPNLIYLITHSLYQRNARTNAIPIRYQQPVAKAAKIGLFLSLYATTLVLCTNIAPNSINCSRVSYSYRLLVAISYVRKKGGNSFG